MNDAPPDIPHENWQDALEAHYPLARSVGFSCQAGWRNILARLFTALEKAVAAQPDDFRAAFRIEQIKQKFGRLTVYLTGGGLPAIRAALDEAERASVVTCEVCGAAGSLADRNGWTSVRCADHETWSRFEQESK